MATLTPREKLLKDNLTDVPNEMNKRGLDAAHKLEYGAESESHTPFISAPINTDPAGAIAGLQEFAPKPSQTQTGFFRPTQSKSIPTETPSNTTSSTPNPVKK
ncbi:MAG: hypothetical protein ABI597_09175 [Gammaproteobacteria bacterium]